MSRTSRAPAIIVAALVALLTVAGCGDNVDESAYESATESSTSPGTSTDQPEADPTDAEKSCQAIVGSGAVEDIQAVWDKYKDNNRPFTPADEQRMRDALDALAKAGDNAEPKVREDVVKLVADVGALIDTREGLPGVGDVPTPTQIQRQIDSLCR